MHRSSRWFFAVVLLLITASDSQSVRHIVFGLERRVRHRVEVGGLVVLENAVIPPSGDLAFDGPVVSPTSITDSGCDPGGVESPPTDPGRSGLRVGPNPSFGRLRLGLTVSSPGVARFSLFDPASGRRLCASARSLHVGENELFWILPADLRAGLYLLRLSGVGPDRTRKILLLRPDGGDGP